jgi:hypothetical protein
MKQKHAHLQHELEHQVRLRTGRQIRNLIVELGPEKVVLRGRASSYYAKQLAQQGVRDVLPEVRLENSITVDSGAAVLAG